jgi:hypothetical protein
MAKSKTDLPSTNEALDGESSGKHTINQSSTAVGSLAETGGHLPLKE